MYTYTIMTKDGQTIRPIIAIFKRKRQALIAASYELQQLGYSLGDVLSFEVESWT